MFIGMSLAQYLEILSQAAPDNGPWTEDTGAPEHLNGAFAEFAKALVTYVNAAMEHVAYDVVRDSLEQVVHTFPATEEPADFDPFTAIQEALLKAMGEAPEAFTTPADGPEGAPKE